MTTQVYVLKILNNNPTIFLLHYFTDFNEPITNNMALQVDGFVCDKNNDCYQRGGTEKQGPFYESCTMTCPKTYLRIKKNNVRTDLRNFSPCTSELS